MNFKLIIILSLSVLFSSHIYAQDTLLVRDIETWAGIEIEKKLFGKKLRLNLTEEFRFNDNSSQIKEFFTEGDISYKIFENTDLGFGYRFTKQNKQEENFISGHRIHFDLGYKYNIKRLSLDSRVRFQSSNDTWFDKTESDHSVNKYRLKLSGSYDIKSFKFDPYISSEIFYISTFDNDPFLDDEYSYDFKTKGFEKLRLTAGTKYKIKNAGRIKFFFRYEHEFSQYANIYDLPENYFIIGLNYKFSF